MICLHGPTRWCPGIRPAALSEIEDVAVAATESFIAFMRGYVEDWRADPRDGLITTCILLLNAGHEATVHAMAIAVKTLLKQETP